MKFERNFDESKANYNYQTRSLLNTYTKFFIQNSIIIEDLIKNISASTTEIQETIIDRVRDSVRETVESAKSSTDEEHEEHWRLMIFQGARIHFQNIFSLLARERK